MSAAYTDRRVLGAVRFIDATTRLTVDAPLRVRAPGVRWIRNRRGYYVIADAPRLGAHAASFDSPPPGDVPLGDVAVELTVADPAGRYLPRRRKIYLPRDSDPSRAGAFDPSRPPDDFDPAGASRTGSLFRPMDVVLFPSPSAPVEPGWALVRAFVAGGVPGEGLAGALIRVVRTGTPARHLASGMSDARGEALVPVAGIPVVTWSEGGASVLATEVDVRLEVVHDPQAGDVPDPFELERRRAQLLVRSATAKLRSGRLLVVRL